jgi:hypothetical protein
MSACLRYCITVIAAALGEITDPVCCQWISSVCSIYVKDLECTQNGNQNVWKWPRGRKMLGGGGVLEELDCEAVADWITWFWKRFSGGVLGTRWWTCRIHRRRVLTEHLSDYKIIRRTSLHYVILSYQDPSTRNMFSLLTFLKRKKCVFDFKTLTVCPHVNFCTRRTIFTKLYTSFVQMAVIPTRTF